MQPDELKTVPGYEHTLIWMNAGTPDFSIPEVIQDWLQTDPGPTHRPLGGPSRLDDYLAENL